MTDNDDRIRKVSRMLIDQTGKQNVYKHDCYRHHSAFNMGVTFPVEVNVAGLRANSVIQDDTANVLSSIMRRLESL